VPESAAARGNKRPLNGAIDPNRRSAYKNRTFNRDELATFNY
jgi:hypothetical protein